MIKCFGISAGKHRTAFSRLMMAVDTLSGTSTPEGRPYGVPEIYIVAADGTIGYRHVGPVSQAILNDTLLPIVRRLKTSAPKSVSQWVL